LCDGLEADTPPFPLAAKPLSECDPLNHRSS
jgi:hypothetical protein